MKSYKERQAEYDKCSKYAKVHKTSIAEAAEALDIVIEINWFCFSCKKLCAGCEGSFNPVYSNCIYRETTMDDMLAKAVIDAVDAI